MHSGCQPPMQQKSLMGTVQTDLWVGEGLPHDVNTARLVVFADDRHEPDSGVHALVLRNKAAAAEPEHC
jgi:hypothetical protein